MAMTPLGGIGLVVPTMGPAMGYGSGRSGLAADAADCDVNLDLVPSIGADAVIDYTKEDFTRGTRRDDVILDVPHYAIHSLAEAAHPCLHRPALLSPSRPPYLQERVAKVRMPDPTSRAADPGAPPAHPARAAGVPCGTC
jgi:hypothetical protein